MHGNCLNMKALLLMLGLNLLAVLVFIKLIINAQESGKKVWHC